MNWQEALAEIQSVEFDVNLNVVSGTNAFFRAVSKEPAVLEAYRQMRESGELREEVLGRIYDLATQEVDPRYANPNDTPLAVLLWLTYFGAHDFVSIAAALVSDAPQCWYARKLARRILDPPSSTTGAVRIGETPDGPRVATVPSGSVKFTMSHSPGNSRKFYEGKHGVTSTTPVTMWQIPVSFGTAANEGIS